MALQTTSVEFKNPFSGTLGKVLLSALAIVPLLYGALYLWAFWDPYGSLNHIPVALVNSDIATKTSDGATVSAGADITKELLDRKTFEWHQVSTAEAERGLKDGTYYLSLTIPHNFSASLASASDDTPHQATLFAKQQLGANFLAPQIGDRVMSEVRVSAAQSASASYYDDIFLSLDDIGSSLKKAGDGADTLRDGISTAQKGAQSLSTGTASVKKGVGKLHTGSAKLTSATVSLSKGSKKLVSGTADLTGGAKSLNAGAQQLNTGTRSLYAGLDSLNTGGVQLSADAHQVEDGVLKAQDSVLSMASATAQLSSVASLNSSLVASLIAEIRAQSGGELTAEQSMLIGQAQAVSGGLATNSSALASSVKSSKEDFATLAAGAAHVASASTQLSGGLQSVTDGAATLTQGTQSISLATPKLIEGAAKVQGGVVKVSNGLIQVNTGAQKLTDGLDSARTGAVELNAGAQKLASGLTPAKDGAGELAKKLNNGADDIPDYTTSQRTSHTEMMSNPVMLETTKLGSTPTYGTGFAPYFIPLAIWVGALVGYLFVSPLPKSNREQRTAGTAILQTLYGFIPMLMLTLLQVALLGVVVVYGLGLTPQHPALFWATLVMCALVFSAIMQWLNVSFGPVGKFLSIILLMLQLTSAGATFPIETLVPFFQTISPLMPMTYMVKALRIAVSGGMPTSTIVNCLGTIASFGVGALVLTALTARTKWADMTRALGEKIGL